MMLVSIVIDINLFKKNIYMLKIFALYNHNNSNLINYYL